MSHTSLALCCGVDGEQGWWLAVPVNSHLTYTDQNDEYALWKTLTDRGSIRCAWLYAYKKQNVEGYRAYHTKSGISPCSIIRESVFRLVRVYRDQSSSKTFLVRLAGIPSINAAYKQYESELSDADDDEGDEDEGDYDGDDVASSEEEEQVVEKEEVVIAPPANIPTPTSTIITTTEEVVTSPKVSPVGIESLLLVSVRDLQALLASTRTYHLTDMLSPTHCRACSSIILMPQSVPVTGLRMQLPPIPRQGITPEMLASQRQFLSTAVSTGKGDPSRFIELKCQCAHPPTYFWCRAGARMIHHVNVADWNEVVASNLPTPKGPYHGGKRART